MSSIDDYKDKIIQGDTLEVLRKFPSNSIDTIITSPPYWGLRDYGIKGQIGLEPTLEEYIEKLLLITAELKRVLKPSGTIWWNHGDCYGGSGAGTWKNPPEVINSKEVYHLPYGSNPRKRNNVGIKPKCMALQNYRFILRCVDELGFILRNIIIWYKPNHMPSSVKDRFTNAYEPVFMLVKSKKYWFDLDAVRVPHKTPLHAPGNKPREKLNPSHGEDGHLKEPDRIWGSSLGKNPGDLWTIPTQPFPEAHFATFPERLVKPMIEASCPQWICKKCGFIRERITKVERKLETHRKKLGIGIKTVQATETSTIHHIVSHYTLGWTTCNCNAGWDSGIVLDPFAGSGTTLLVARKLNRHYIGIELNPEYVKMAEKRLRPYKANISDWI